YSRMREVHKLTEDPKHAIQQGVIKTGPIITAAALTLFVVVAAFSASSILFMQIIGIGLAVAVLVDAFFVRLILVPSIMALMGKISWYSPKWLLRRKKR
ncbi:MAG: MMPL family transporter, partial [Candidatus Saccharimonadaceae bacterium]|nr:MMPL family transporter [Candidatus Saccharimonadaceae bacterium]